MNIKHAALIFVVFDLVLLYLCIRKRKQGRRQWALTAGILFLVNLLWGRHCDYVFAGASVSRHSLSVDWFGMILGDKTTEEIADTVKMVLVRLVTRTECLWILAWFLVLGMLVLRGVNKGVKKQYALFLVSGVSLYGVYSIGIGAMYVFSMENYGELLAFTRYMRSIDVAIYYMLTVFSGLYLTELTNRQHAVTVGIILIFLTAAGWHWQTGEYLKEKLACCPVEWRQELEQPITEYRIQRGKRYLLCVNEEHHGWPRRLWRYNLQTDAVDQVMVTDVSELQIVKDYDYVVVLDEGNPIIEAWVRENYPDAIGNTVIENFL